MTIIKVMKMEEKESSSSHSSLPTNNLSPYGLETMYNIAEILTGNKIK
jgi:hypothetical protein